MTALPILEICENSFRLKPKNFLTVLEKVGPHPFAIYSINGATRTGKSYVLNYFIRYLEAKEDKNFVGSWLDYKIPGQNNFVWRSGKERETVGINIWSKPYFVQDESDQGGHRKVAIILMDTQGLFDERTTARQNAIIFSLSALCSSVSIFNVMKNIDENVLQQLQFFSGYAKLVSTGQNEHDDPEKGDHETSFQKLVFLIRDFDFPDYELGYHDMTSTIPESAQNFCRDTFVPQNENLECPMENIFVRRKIMETYRDVAVTLFPYPGRKFIKDSNSEKPHHEFMENLKNFVELMIPQSSSPSQPCTQLVTKKIGGQEVTGLEFQKYVSAWAKLCDEAEKYFPPAQTILETTAMVQNTLALNTARSSYEEEMKILLKENPAGVSDPTFQIWHETLKERVIGEFREMKKITSSSTDLQTQYETMLVEAVDKIFETNRKINAMLQDKDKLDKECQKQREQVQKVQDKMAAMEIKNASAIQSLEKQNSNLHTQIQREREKSERQHLEFNRQMLDMQKFWRKNSVRWTPCTNGDFPLEAFQGATEGQFRAYVIRAHFNGAVIPGKLIAGLGFDHVFVGTCWVEHNVKSYEVLEDPQGTLRWVSRTSAEYSKALVAGRSEDGDKLLIARGWVNGCHVVGKAHQGYGQCHLPFNGKEHLVGDFEVLVQD